MTLRTVFSRTLSTACLAAAGLIGATNSSAAAFSNGNFEAGLSPWTSAGNVVITGPSGGAFWFGGGSAAQNGTRAAAFNSGDGPTNGVLSQTFDTVAGTTYLVSFDFGTSWRGYQGVTATAWNGVNSGLLGELYASDDNRQTAADQLASFSFSFIATGASSTLRFSDTLPQGSSTSSQDGILDNVRVVAQQSSNVPEPASLGLLGLGLAGLGLKGRRKAT